MTNARKRPETGTPREPNLKKAALLAASALSLITLTTFMAAPAQAQGFINMKKETLQDASSFYMSRRQVQIIDNSPIVNYSGGGGPGAQGAPAAGFGGNMGRAPLQRAGFQSYSTGMPQYAPQNLPHVNNGVPPKQEPRPNPGPRSMSAKAGGLSNSKGGAGASAGGSGPGKHSAPNTVSAYNTYKGYSPATTPQPQGAGSGGGLNSSTAVQGSILHWSKRNRGGQ